LLFKSVVPQENAAQDGCQTSPKVVCSWICIIRTLPVRSLIRHRSFFDWAQKNVKSQCIWF